MENPLTCDRCHFSPFFATQHDLDAHERTKHGCFYCPYCIRKPYIRWQMAERLHMERCHYPNPLNDLKFKDIQEPDSSCGQCARYLREWLRYTDEHVKNCQPGNPHTWSSFRPQTFSGLFQKESQGRHMPNWREDRPRSAHGEFGSRGDRPYQDQERHRPDWREDNPKSYAGYQYYNPEDNPNRRKYDHYFDPKAKANERKGNYFKPREHASTSPPPPPREPPREAALIDIYAILGINVRSTAEEVQRAARKRRIETHPDKLKREGLSRSEVEAIDEEAKTVGWAADIVLDPEKRRVYDRKVKEWKEKYER